MARKKKIKKESQQEIKTERKFNQFNDLEAGTLQSVWGIMLFVLSVFFLFAAFNNKAGDNMAGAVGKFTYDFLSGLFGYGYYLLPLIFLILAISFFTDRERSFSYSKMAGSLIFFCSGLGLFSLVKTNSGGTIGELVSYPLLKLFAYQVSFIALIALVIISILIIFDTALRKEHILFWKLFNNDGDGEEDEEKELKEKKLNKQKEEPDEDEENIKATVAESLQAIKNKFTAKPAEKEEEKEPVQAKEKTEKVSDDTFMVSRKSLLLGRVYTPPPLSLLENDSGKPGVGDIKANANIIKRTLLNFGIDVEMDEITIGPSVTRYALKPAEGVKLSRILGLQNNLSLALAAHPIRIEAPIPGKSLVGIEIPNTVKTTVGLGTLLASEDFQNSEKPLMVALGKGISGKSHFGNLAKMPHMLIAGATGSGKSVTIHAIITSLLYRNSPDNLRMIMIDPKRVELTLYDKIPHLLTPVIKDPKKTIMALRWAGKEMDRRYDILEKNSVRDIDSYHKNVLFPALEKAKKDKNVVDEATLPDTMPYIVIVIDELADIMQAYPRELESAIVRLAQMSRAVGIHLILSTQRPSVNVITGLIKANVPARVALQVASQIDSRTILDTRGAEELLGAGDMLYLSGEMSHPTRIQSAFITEVEVKKVVKHLRDNRDDLGTAEIQLGNETNGGAAVNDPVFSSSPESGMANFSDSGNMDDDDDLYEEAKDIVIKAGKGSTSYIQRKLRVGYARAARLMDMLEERGVIGPADGSKPREVIGGYNVNEATHDAENLEIEAENTSNENEEKLY